MGGIGKAIGGVFRSIGGVFGIGGGNKQPHFDYPTPAAQAAPAGDSGTKEPPENNSNLKKRRGKKALLVSLDNPRSDYSSNGTGLNL